MWHTDFQFRETAHPHEITIDLGAAYELSGFAYLPRPGGGNGTIGRYECYVSDNRKEMGQAIVAGEFSQGRPKTWCVSGPRQRPLLPAAGTDEVAGRRGLRSPNCGCWSKA